MTHKYQTRNQRAGEAVPALLISGALDPVTPLEASRATSRYLSNSQTVLLKNGTHGTGSSCVDGIVTKFVATAGKVDDSCVAEMKLDPFVTKGKLAQFTCY
jgi:hypothetical protein